MAEATYGNRTHARQETDTINRLTGYLQATFDRGGNVVIPSFAVGRAQEILYFLREIKERGLVHGHDGFPVYVDSPLANEATAVFFAVRHRMPGPGGDGRAPRRTPRWCSMACTPS